MNRAVWHIAGAWAIVAAVGMAVFAGQTGDGRAQNSEPVGSTTVQSSQEDRPLGPGPAYDAKVRSDPAGSSNSWLLQTLSALGLVLVLILVVRLLLQRTSAGQTGAGGTRLVELLARSPIGFKTHILFLRINQRVIVASQTSQAVQTLAVLDTPDDVSWVLEHARGVRPGFGQVLHRFSREHDLADGPTAQSLTEEDRLRQRISDLARKSGSTTPEREEP